MKKFCIIYPAISSVSSLQPLVKSILGDAKVYSFMDDSFLPEVIAAGGVTDSVRQRVLLLVQAAALLEPDAILLTCTAIGDLADDAKTVTNIPVKRIEEKMCEDAVASGNVIGVAATLSAAIPPISRLLTRIAAEQGKTIELRECLISDTNSIPEKLTALKKDCDIVVLAQPSMAQALAHINEETDKYLACTTSGLAQLLDV